MGLAYTAFVVPTPTADDHNDIIAALTFAQDLLRRGCALTPSPSSYLKGRLSVVSSSRFSFGSFTSGFSIDNDDDNDDDDLPSTCNYNSHLDVEVNTDRNETASGNGNGMVIRRRSKRERVVRRLRVLVDERVRLRRTTGYALIGDENDAIEMW